MASHVSQETPSPLERWLSKVGISEGNPFGVNEADREPFVPECFVDPGVYDTVKNDPHTTLVFAPRGGGKTALRVMLASDCRPIQPLAASPRSQTLAVTYSDFDPALKACDYDLARLTAGHHVDKILRDACSTLLDALWQDPALIAALSPPDRSLLNGYCQQFNPTLLEADAACRRLQSACPEIEIPWPILRPAVAEKRLGALLRGFSLTPALRLYVELVDDTPEPLASSDSPVTLLSGFAQLVQRTGLQAVYILVDRLDEKLLTFRDPRKLAALIAPLVADLPLMEIPGLAFKLFLPREAREAILPFVRTERLAHTKPEPSRALEVIWDNERLRDLLRLRLQVYSNDKVQSLGKLCEDALASRIEDEMIEMADGSPRRLLQLGAALLETHVALSPRKRTITEAAWKQTPAKVLGEQYVRPLRVDRRAAQVYLGETTPVRLSATPYRLVVYLYEARGFRTSEEIKTGVWTEEKYITDDMVRQTIRRVRKALEDAGANPKDYLVTEPGRGYKMQNTA